MPRLHRLAHKAPVMHASMECAFTARQKHVSALNATRRHNSYFKILISCFFCFFFLLESSGGDAETPNAFIFSLNNSEGLAPFVSKVKKEKTETAIYRSSATGPVFGQDLTIFLNSAFAEAILGKSYSVPALVNDELAILNGNRGSFSPDEVQVFYLDPSR